MDFWEQTFLDNTTRTWLTALATAGAILAGFWVLKTFVVHHLLQVAQGTKPELADLIRRVSDKTKHWLVAVVAVYAGSRVLSLPPWIGTWGRAIATIALLVQLAFWGDGLITGWLVRYERRRREREAREERPAGGEHPAVDEHPAAEEHLADELTTLRVLSIVVRVAFAALVALIALDNIPGVEITTLLASLGIGGIAVALAVQSILGDVFASLIIVLDKPFRIGDFITVGDFMGRVEAVGLKTTRVRSHTGEEVIFGNSDLLNSRIRNYRSLAKRTVISSIGVTCETPCDKLRRIPGIIQEVVETQEHVQFVRAHLNEYGPFSYDYQVVYSVLSPDIGPYMDARQAVNLGIIKRFEEEGIEMPYPTQVIHIRERDQGNRSQGLVD